MTTLTNDEKFTASFVFYYSFADMISKIPDREIRLQAYEMLFEYALFGIEPQIEHWAVDMVFSAVKPQIDANNKRRKNGKKGGRKPAQEKATQAQTQPEVQAQPTVEAETAAQMQVESAIQIEQARQEAPTVQAEPVMQAQPMQPVVQPTPAVQAQPTAEAVAQSQQIASAQTRTETAAQAQVQAHLAVQAQPAAAAQPTSAAQAQQTATAKVEAAVQPEAPVQVEPEQLEKIVHFGENQYPTTPTELGRFEKFAYKLFEKYHGSKPNLADIEQVLERTYTRIVRPDGEAIAAFDRDKADLLEYAFEKAQSAGKLDWRYVDGMYRNFAAQNRTRSFSV